MDEVKSLKTKKKVHLRLNRWLKTINPIIIIAYFREINISHCSHFGQTNAHDTRVWASQSSPRSCSQRPTASPPCASGVSYPERPRLRGAWACSRARVATAPRAPAEGARRCAAGWPEWGRGWKWCGGTPRRSTWTGWSHRSRSPDRALEPGAGWTAGRRRSPEWTDGTAPMDPSQMPLFGQHLQLDPWLFCPQSKTLFLVSDLEKTKSSVSTLKTVYLV